MLDQNTDRTYWMIGAVVVVAILIAAARVTFPDIFDRVMDEFLEVLTGTTGTPATGFINPFSIDSLTNFWR